MTLLFILIPLPAKITIPKTKVKSAMLLPIILPKLKEGLFVKAELMPTNNSGSVVANAKIINPLVNSLILKNAEILDTLLTTHVLLLTRIKVNTQKKMKSVNNAIMIFLPQKITGLHY